ncbi:unnamed protein product, partial [Thlaspi arvense]
SCGSDMSSSKKRKLNWSELCPDVLRFVLERLSFTDVNRAKSVCLAWHLASRGCVPKPNQIPWLILFPHKEEANNDSSCVLFVPEDRDKVYKTRDLGVDFVRSCCLATHGSWLLMMDIHWNLNILNPLTGERIDLPLAGRKKTPPPQDACYFDNGPPKVCPSLACLWIDDRSKYYVVAWNEKVTKTGSNTWRWLPCSRLMSGWDREGSQLVYEHRAQKLYFHSVGDAVKVWCLSGDDPKQVSEDYAPINYEFWGFLPDRSKDEKLYLKEEERYVKGYVDSRLTIAVSRVSGRVLKVAIAEQKSKRWFFRVYEMHPTELAWQVIDSLGDEALILDMGITVVAKDIPGIKRNSIYFSGFGYRRKNPDHLFVFDLTTHKVEPLPQCVFSSIPFTDARWFFPGFTASLTRVKLGAMGQSKKKAHRRRREEEGIPGSSSNWSELCPDLVRCVFKRLSFTALNRAKSVCSSWHTASRGCIPKRNQIPWLILFPRKDCVWFVVPEDKDKVYRTRDLGSDFAESLCLMTCGSWLLMSNPMKDLYMINPLTGERIDLPDTPKHGADLIFEQACFWIDNETKDYIVLLEVSFSYSIFTKKGDENKWHEFPLLKWDMILSSVTRIKSSTSIILITLSRFRISQGIIHAKRMGEGRELYWQKLLYSSTRIAVTLSGDVLIVACILFSCKTWHFRIYKTNHMTREWVKITSLGNEALIYDMGITVSAKNIPGIKRNSIYFSGLDHGTDDPDHIFVYDLSTQKMQTLPQRVFSSIHFSDARWFFPC